MSQLWELNSNTTALFELASFYEINSPPIPLVGSTVSAVLVSPTGQSVLFSSFFVPLSTNCTVYKASGCHPCWFWHKSQETSKRIMTIV